MESKQTARRVSSVEVAKIIRAELKTTFPGVKFSVRKDSYYAVKVNWVDGPTTDAVNAVVGQFKGQVRRSVDDSSDYVNITYKGELIRCENDFLFLVREYSVEVMQKAVEWYKGYWANPARDIEVRNATSMCRAYIYTIDSRAAELATRWMWAQAF